MIIGRVACEGEDDSVTKASAADMSSAGPYQEEEPSPQGPRASKAHYRCAALLAAPWHCEMRLSLHMSAEFHYQYLRVGNNKALLPALEICHPASCFHSTSPLQMVLWEKYPNAAPYYTQSCWWMWRLLSDSRFGLCGFLKICEGPEAHFPPLVLHYASSLFHNSPFHLVPLLSYGVTFAPLFHIVTVTLLAPKRLSAFSHSCEGWGDQHR